MKTTYGYRTMRQIQMCLLFIAICFGVQRVEGQSCFVQLGDATGMNISDYEDELEAAACALIDAFPEALQDSFAVYDLGFYGFRSLYQQTIEDFFEAFVDQSLNQQYYLVFGRVVDERGNLAKIFVKVKLPNTNIFECSTQLQLESIQKKLIKTVKQNTFLSIVSAILQLKSVINDMENCCQPGFQTQCNECLNSDQIESLLGEDCHRIYTSTFTIDSSLFQFNAQRSSFFSGEGFWVIEFDDGPVNVVDLMNSFANDVADLGLSFQGFVTSNENTCNSTFETMRNNYENSQADVKIWWHFNNADENSEGVIYEYANLESLYESIGGNILEHLSEEGLVNQYGACSGTKRFGYHEVHFTEGDWGGSISKEEGILAHRIIQSYYFTIFPGWQVEAEYKIPESSKKGNYGYADIVNLSLAPKEIFEIKTIYSWKKGDDEVKKYVEKANIHCQPIVSRVSFERGITYPDKVYLPWFTHNKVLVSYLHKQVKACGVITYEFQEGLKKPSPNPVFVPQSKWDEIRDLLENMAKNPPVAKDLAWAYLQLNPEMQHKLLVIGTLGILGAALITAASYGTSSAATVPMSIAAGTLIIVCIDFDPNLPSPY
jgi:hypothetical protein